MNKMREAFEKLNPVFPKDSANFEIGFEAGYQAAIADVKAGGVQSRGGVCFDGPPLYKLPEDV